MVALDMTKKQFECVKSLASHEDATLKAHDFKLSDLTEDGNSGHVHTKEIDADFEYREDAHTLVFSNEQKHGLYDFVSDSTIGQHLMQLLGDLKCPEKVETEVPMEQQVPQSSNIQSTPSFVKPTITSNS